MLSLSELDAAARKRNRNFCASAGLVVSAAGDKRQPRQQIDKEIEFAIGFLENAPVEILTSLLLGWEAVTASIVQQLRTTKVPAKLTAAQVQQIRFNRDFARRLYLATEFKGDDQRAPFWEQFTKKCYPFIQNLPSGLDIPEKTSDVRAAKNRLWRMFFLRLVELPFTMESNGDEFDQRFDVEALTEKFGQQLLTCTDLVGSRFDYSLDLDYDFNDSVLDNQFPSIFLTFAYTDLSAQIDLDNVAEGSAYVQVNAVAFFERTGKDGDVSDALQVFGQSVFNDLDKIILDVRVSGNFRQEGRRLFLGGLQLTVEFSPRNVDDSFLRDTFGIFGDASIGNEVQPRVFAKYLAQPFVNMKVGVYLRRASDPDGAFEIGYDRMLADFVIEVRKITRDNSPFKVQDEYGIDLGTIYPNSDAAYELAELGWPEEVRVYVSSN